MNDIIKQEVFELLLDDNMVNEMILFEQDLQVSHIFYSQYLQ